MAEIKNQCIFKRLRFAGEGLVFAWRKEKSFRTQVTLGVAAVLSLVTLGGTPVWAGIFLLCIGMVLGMELFNTALEHWIDEVQPEIKPGIKQAKDCAAAAVLVSSLVSLLVFLCFVYTRFSGALHE